MYEDHKQVNFIGNSIITRTDRMRFTREVILQDAAVQRANATKWGEIQESYNEALYDNYKMWAEYVWSQWVRYKNKTVKRKQATSEKKKDKGKLSHSRKSTDTSTCNL